MTRNEPLASLRQAWRSGWWMLIALMVMMGGIMSQGPISAEDQPARRLRHVVMFKFKDGTAEADIRKVVEAFRGLKTKIPQISHFEYGTDNSPEGLANGFTHCFLITFRSEADRAIYLPHPAHQAFVDVLKPHLDKVHVLDYWAQE